MANFLPIFTSAAWYLLLITDTMWSENVLCKEWGLGKNGRCLAPALPFLSACGSWSRTSRTWGACGRIAGPTSDLSQVPVHTKVGAAQGHLSAGGLFAISLLLKGKKKWLVVQCLGKVKISLNMIELWYSSATILELKSASLLLIFSNVYCYLLIKAWKSRHGLTCHNPEKYKNESSHSIIRGASLGS